MAGQVAGPCLANLGQVALGVALSQVLFTSVAWTQGGLAPGTWLWRENL